MMRRLTADERELWERLRRSVRPLRPTQDSPPAEVASAREPDPSGSLDSKAAAAPLPPGAGARPSPPPLVLLEDRAKRRLSRGLAEVDARIDLHGMRQDRAFAALFSFLRHGQARGARIVLVITGKGRAGEDGRGVLRHAVPAWLARPEFRDLVVGFEEAARRHGGAGALYVRLRRRREAGRTYP